MTAYDHDPRVTKDGEVYLVQVEPALAGRVEPAGNGHWWGSWTTGDPQKLPYQTADEAIESFIGTPQ